MSERFVLHNYTPRFTDGCDRKISTFRILSTYHYLNPYKQTEAHKNPLCPYRGAPIRGGGAHKYTLNLHSLIHLNVLV